MKNKIVLVAAISFAILTYSLAGCNTSTEEKQSSHTEHVVSYQCPMGCEDGKTYDAPGQCPVCEMDLEKTE